MRHEQDIAGIIKQVLPWPEEDRVALIFQLMSESRKQTRKPAPRNIAAKARGIARGSTQAPDDATVKAWMDEYRTRKYG